MILRRFLMLSVFIITPAFAQEAQPVTAPQAEQTQTAAQTPAVGEATSENKNLTPEQQILAAIEKELKQKLAQDVYIPPSISSLVFAPNQYSLLREARQGFNTRLPSKDELEAEKVSLGDDVVLDENKKSILPSLREIQLGGIVFITPDEWTIWLNKQRVTPSTIPQQATDLRVYREFIELRWLDAASNQVFPIRLRPNQRFNLDSKVFLPGQTDSVLTSAPANAQDQTMSAEPKT